MGPRFVLCPFSVSFVSDSMEAPTFLPQATSRHTHIHAIWFSGSLIYLGTFNMENEYQFVKFFFKRLYLFIFRERGRGGEKHQCVFASYTPPTRDRACNPGMCPDWESNQWPFSSQALAQSTELHQPGPICELFKWPQITGFQSGAICSPVDILQCLDTFRLSWVGGGGYQHLVCRGQGCG